MTQTVRNYVASLGLAVLGTVLVTQLRSHLTTSLAAQGLTHRRAAELAARLSQSQGSSGGSTASIPHHVRLDFATATQTVFHVMAAVMALGAIVALLGLEWGLQSEEGAGVEPEPARVEPEPARVRRRRPPA